jgi:hypothetical protein
MDQTMADPCLQLTLFDGAGNLAKDEGYEDNYPCKPKVIVTPKQGVIEPEEGSVFLTFKRDEKPKD